MDFTSSNTYPSVMNLADLLFSTELLLNNRRNPPNIPFVPNNDFKRWLLNTLDKSSIRKHQTSSNGIWHFIVGLLAPICIGNLPNSTYTVSGGYMTLTYDYITLFLVAAPRKNLDMRKLHVFHFDLSPVDQSKRVAQQEFSMFGIKSIVARLKLRHIRQAVHDAINIRIYQTSNNGRYEVELSIRLLPYVELSDAAPQFILYCR